MPSAAPSSHALQCRCGRLRGLLRPTRPANRCVCYCADCQAFARHLGQAEAVLDAHGGSDIIQVLPAHLSFSQGLDQLACLRLSDKGLLRWYAACCRTPIGNTASGRGMSFVGLLHCGLRADPVSLDQAFGPVRMRVNTASATAVTGAPGAGAPVASGQLRGIAKVLVMMAGARLSGSYLRNPFFEAVSGEPIVRPQLLTAEQLAAARASPGR
jgi:hypothetical protein